MDIKSVNVGTYGKCLIMNVIGEFYFFQDSTQHVPSETSEDPEVEVTIEG